MPITFESDWQGARDLLAGIIARHAPDMDAPEASESVRRAAREHLISYTHLSPAVYIDADERGVRLTGRLLCEVRQRRGVVGAAGDAAGGHEPR